MPLFGTLKTMPLPDLLQWMGSARRSGTLRVECNRVHKSILLQDGEIVGCSSDDPPERLGQFLLARGRISEDELRSALAHQESSGEFLGGVFVSMGVLSEQELTAHLEAKAEETIYSLFDWDDAFFRFHDELANDANTFPVRLRVEDVLLRGMQRFDELQRIRSVFDDPHIVLRRGTRVPPPEILGNDAARTLFEAIDGVRTVAEILLHVHGSEYLVTKFLFELHRSGFVEIEPSPTTIPAPQPVEPPAAERQGRASHAEEVAEGAHEDLVVALLGEQEPSSRVSRVSAAPATLQPESEATRMIADAVVPGQGPSIGTSAGGPAAGSGAVADSVAPTEPELLVDDLAEPPPVLASPTGPVTQPPGPEAPAEGGGEAAQALIGDEILDIPDLFAESSDLEPIEHSTAHQTAAQLERARQCMTAGRFAEALDVLDDLYRRFPDDESLRRLAAEAEAAFKDKAYRHYLPALHVPVLKMSPEELEAESLSPTDYFLLSRIDGVWDVKSIIQISPVREVEVLLSLTRMRERGIIELRNPAS